MSTPNAPRNRGSKVAKAAKAGRGGPNVWLIVAVVAVIAFAAVIAVALSQEEGGDDVAATADVDVTGDALPQDGTGTAVGMDAPELSGTGLEGESLTIGADGRPKVVTFLAHWCPHCQNEVPRIVDWAEDGNMPDDVDLYGVSTSINPAADNYPPHEWLEEEGWTGLVPTLRDDAGSSAHRAFGGGGFPYFVAVDESGQVVAQQSGEIGTDQLESLIEQARAGA